MAEQAGFSIHGRDTHSLGAMGRLSKTVLEGLVTEPGSVLNDLGGGGFGRWGFAGPYILRGWGASTNGYMINLMQEKGWRHPSAVMGDKAAVTHVWWEHGRRGVCWFSLGPWSCLVCVQT